MVRTKPPAEKPSTEALNKEKKKKATSTQKKK